jgi:hypothetical protein
MADLPVPFGSNLHSSRAVTRAARAQDLVTEEIYKKQLQAEFEKECDAIDSRAAGEASLEALRVEFEVDDWGAQHASTAVRKELLAAKLAQLSEINTRRIGRQFGDR